MKRWLRQQWLYIVVPLLLWGLVYATGLVGAPKPEGQPVQSAAETSQTTPLLAGQTSADGAEYLSPAGLRYGDDPSPEFDSRIDHVMAHTRPDPEKPKHSIFLEKNPVKVLQLIDEAWNKRGPPEKQGKGAGRDVYTVAMQRPVGEEGEESIRIIVESGSSDIVTAYPYHEAR